MAKKTDNGSMTLMKIFWEGICIYCKYFTTFLKYMFFPVFGQIIGISLILTVNYFFVVNIPSLIKQYPVLDNIPLVFLLLLICVFPGFLIFCKAFFDYLVAYSSLNLMVCVSRGDKMKNKPLETKTYDDILKKRIGKYIAVLMLFSLISIVGLFPLFIIPFAVLCVYLCLIFQVFMLEETVTPVGVFKRSFYLVKGNFLFTSILISLSWLLTYLLLPKLTVLIFDKINVTQFLAYPVQKYLEILPIKGIIDNLIASAFSSVSMPSVDLNTTSLADMFEIAKSIVVSIISAAVTGLLLPLRCAWFTLLYKKFDNEKTETLRKSHNKKS